MIAGIMDKTYPSAQTLVANAAASRVHAKDATLYDFSPEAQQVAQNFMGWADLASNPPYPVEKVQQLADEIVASGIEYVCLIGQGGSTQAPMTISKYNKKNNRVTFKTMDSDSPVRLRKNLAGIQPEKTLFILASKSGGTIEPRLMLSAVRDYLETVMAPEETVKHLVAITDPGSKVEQQATEEGWLAILPGEPTVGGRFSALSVFGLLPAALIGLDLNAVIEHGKAAEARCSEDSLDNPAIQLAAFLYDGYVNGRDKFSFVTPKRGRVLGLWIEQLVAESVGKQGKGILPNVEVDSLLLASDAGDRSAVVYETEYDLPDEGNDFAAAVACISPEMPKATYRIESAEELIEHFVLWEYATAMCGYLMQVCPFDQPDVASAKAVVLDILRDGMPEPSFTQPFEGALDGGMAEVRVSEQFAGATTLPQAIQQLVGSIRPGDFFAINAFLPFDGEGRREALEAMRHEVAEAYGVFSSLEIGPRYLHSTGQLQKGGPNEGVFLILSAEETIDVPLRNEADSLGALAKSQAVGDFVTLANRGRRCVHVHLPNNAAVTLRLLLAQLRAAVKADA
ncbi:MAG: glucose-6-phosphate isomerase [Coriobacteriia bacterium]|nr:glucose-6-phosphate isomerase [Coriobacteriia bacterium]